MAQDAGAKPKLSGKLMQLKVRICDAACVQCAALQHAACRVLCGLSLRPSAVHAARGGERPPSRARAGAGARHVRCRASSRCEATQPPRQCSSAAPLTRPRRAPQAAPVISEHWVAPAEGATQRWCAAALQPQPLACPCARCGAHRGSPARRSTVIMEDDPKPGALLGRMSFRRAPAALHARTLPLQRSCVALRRASRLRRNYNAETEKLHAEAEARVAEASGAPAQLRVVAPRSPLMLPRPVAGATPGASVSDAQMAQHLGGARGVKHAAGGADEPVAKKQKAKGGAAAAAAVGFLKPPAFTGGRAADKR